MLHSFCEKRGYKDDPRCHCVDGYLGGWTCYGPRYQGAGVCGTCIIKDPRLLIPQEPDAQDPLMNLVNDLNNPNSLHNLLNQVKPNNIFEFMNPEFYLPMKISNYAYESAKRMLDPFADVAVDEYAKMANDPNAPWYEKIGANIGGPLAVLATAEHIDTTYFVLGLASGAAPYARAKGIAGSADDIARAWKMPASRFGKESRRIAVCFTAGTLVFTSAGAQPIEDIRTGDLVLSIDHITGKRDWFPVLETFHRTANELLEIKLADGTTIRVTKEHPFSVGGSWTAAQELRSGQFIDTAYGDVQVISSHLLSGHFTVYNMNVGFAHSYMVGNAKVWVHNDCGQGKIPSLKYQNKNYLKKMSIDAEKVKKDFVGNAGGKYDLYTDKHNNLWLMRKGAAQSDAMYLGPIERFKGY